MSTQSSAVYAHDISLSFGDKPVLRHASLTVQRGEIVCIWGPSGSGKSTFLRVLGGLEKPEAGEVLFLDKPCDMLHPAALDPARDEVGFVFQNCALVSNMSVFDNIALPLRFRRDRLRSRQAGHHSWKLTTRRADIERLQEQDLQHKVDQAMQNMLVYDFRAQFPHQISLGMQKRVAVARAMVMDPRILLMDEPTSGLDYLSRLSLLALISNVSQLRRVSVVMVTHDLLLPRELNAKVSVFHDGGLTPPCSFADLDQLELPFVQELLYELRLSDPDAKPPLSAEEEEELELAAETLAASGIFTPEEAAKAVVHHSHSIPWVPLTEGGAPAESAAPTPQGKSPADSVQSARVESDLLLH
jgi:phospholipid/cholesterol/gamma-HCH transport system ATP-binding protein